MMNPRLQDLIAQNARLSDFVQVGPAQAAAIEQFAHDLISQCVYELVPSEGNEKIADAVWRLSEVFGVDIDPVLDRAFDGDPRNKEHHVTDF